MIDLQMSQLVGSGISLVRHLIMFSLLKLYMALDISLQEHQKINFFFFQNFKRKLFLRLSLLITFFSLILISLLYYLLIELPFDTTDPKLDAIEMYYMSDMVHQWDNPININKVEESIHNLDITCQIIELEQDSSYTVLWTNATRHNQ